MLVKLQDIFDVQYGTSLELNSLVLDEFGINFVSRTEKNNGVSARVKQISNIDPIPAGALTVAASGSVLETFLQPEPFYSGYHLFYLTPKMEMSDATKLYYATCIKANKFRYSYGRQANRTIRDLLIPSLDEIPAWVDSATTVVTNDTKNNNPKTPLQHDKWQPFVLGNVFEIKKGTRLTKADQSRGDLAYIGAIDHNNGLSARISGASKHPAGTITVNYNGNGVAEAFFQPEPYWASDDVNIIYSKNGILTAPIGLFIATVIRFEKYRFSYGRKWGLERMQRSIVYLPASFNIEINAWEPDWAFMEAYIKNLPFSNFIASTNRKV